MMERIQNQVDMQDLFKDQNYGENANKKFHTQI